MWWEDRSREYDLLTAGVRLGLPLSQLGAPLGIGSGVRSPNGNRRQGVLDRIDRLAALLRYDRPDASITREARRLGGLGVGSDDAQAGWLMVHGDELASVGDRLLAYAELAEHEAAEYLVEVRQDLRERSWTPGSLVCMGLAAAALRTSPAVLELGARHGVHRAVKAVEDLRILVVVSAGERLVTDSNGQRRTALARRGEKIGIAPILLVGNGVIATFRSLALRSALRAGTASPSARLVMLADGGDRLGDLCAMGDQQSLFGEVASDATAFRVIAAIGGDPALLAALREGRVRAADGLRGPGAEGTTPTATGPAGGRPGASGSVTASRASQVRRIWDMGCAALEAGTGDLGSWSMTSSETRSKSGVVGGLDALQAGARWAVVR